MRRFIITPPAQADLDAIQDSIQLHSMSASVRMGAALAAAFELLAEHPHIGHARPDLTEEPYLFWPVKAYLIVYRPESDPLQIIRVLHGALDVKRVL